MRVNVARYLADLQALGFSRVQAAPPFVRLAWRCGWAMRPPLYWPFYETVAKMGGAFGTLTALLIALVDAYVRHRVMPMHYYFGTLILGGGISYGLLMAAMYAHLRRRCAALPDWTRYIAP